MKYAKTIVFSLVLGLLLLPHIGTMRLYCGCLDTNGIWPSIIGFLAAAIVPFLLRNLKSTLLDTILSLFMALVTSTLAVGLFCWGLKQVEIDRCLDKGSVWDLNTGICSDSGTVK